MGFYTLVLYPILRADRAYDDDLKRALIGRASWDANGRPLTTLVMRALQSYDHAMVDISPLPQIGAIAVLALIGAMLARRHAIGPPWVAALVAFPLGAQPFFLQNLSYKFDALSMSLAMLFAVMPTLRTDRRARDWWLGVLALLLSLALYQPAINVYLVFVLLELVLMQLDDRPLRPWLAQAGRRAGQIVTGMVIYELLIGIHISGWVMRQSEPIVHWRNLPLLLSNFAAFYSRVGNDFSWHWWTYYAPLLLVMAAVPACIGVRYAYRQRVTRARWATLGVAILGALMPLWALVLAVGPMLLLRHPEMYPRVLMGLGGLLCAGLVMMHAAAQRWGRSPRWTQAGAIMLALGMAVLASAYGNAMSSQKIYEQHIAAGLADALAQAPPVHGLVIDGSAGYAPLARHVVQELPIMGSLVPSYLNDRDTFDTRNFLMYYVPDLVDPHDPRLTRLWDQRTHLAAATCAISPIQVTASYRLYVIDSVAVVRFINEPSGVCAPHSSEKTAG